jgi:hypothetical protein
MWRHRGSRERLSVSAAGHPVAARCGTVLSTRVRGSPVCGGDICKSLGAAVGVSVSGDRPVRPGHRRAGLPEARSGGHRRFFICALAYGSGPVKVTTDQISAYPRVIEE